MTLDINEIQKILPHRPPFLLVDRILEIEPSKRIVGIKNVTVNEPFFVGHFPSFPVMPGVLIIEAMAQTGGVLVLREFPDPSQRLVYFAAFNKHIGFYPIPTGIEQFKEELSVYKTGKGSVQFPFDEPIPYDLIRRIVKFRVKENLAKAAAKGKK